MVAHLTSHSDLIVQYMTLPQREEILTRRLPVVYLRRNDKSRTLHFAACLHCKEGSVSCSQRSKASSIFLEGHEGCKKDFFRYEKAFQLKEEPKAHGLAHWTEISPAKYKEIKGTPLVVEYKTPKPVEGSALPKTAEDNILKLWKSYEDARVADEKAEAEREGEPYEPDEEPEPDLMGKLTDILNDYNMKKMGIKRCYKTIQTQRDEISVLENDINLLKEQNQRMSEQLQKEG